MKPGIHRYMFHAVFAVYSFNTEFPRLKTSLVKTCFPKAIHMCDIELIAWEVVSASESGEIDSVGRYRFLAGAVFFFIIFFFLPLIHIHSYSQID